MDGNKTSKSLSFWRHFEEPTLKASLDSSNISATNTRQREEPDQDTGNKQYCAIPTRIFCGTETQTFAREEPDQDIENKQYCAIPTHISCGTKTLTEQREEPHQDESSYKYAAIPMNT
jgi:hypothetical protein